MTKRITRREFVCAGAALAAGLAAGVQAQAGPPRAGVRYVHAEIPCGPYTRAELSRIAARIAAEAGLGAPLRSTGLGAPAAANVFPERFTLSLDYGNARVLLNACTQRGNRLTLTLRLVDGTSVEIPLDHTRAA